MRNESLIDALRNALDQELRLLRELPGQIYTRPSEGPFSASVGKHIRHNLDHFTAFFAGLEAGRVDYESRSRNPEAEQNPEEAARQIEVFSERLETLKPRGDGLVEVREETDDAGEERRWLPSSLGREFQFLLGHTVHHNALIAMVLGEHGAAVPEGFGVAPSTRRHEERVARASG